MYVYIYVHFYLNLLYACILAPILGGDQHLLQYPGIPPPADGYLFRTPGEVQATYSREYDVISRHFRHFPLFT